MNTIQFTRRNFLKLGAAGAMGAAWARLETEAAEFNPPAGQCWRWAGLLKKDK